MKWRLLLMACLPFFISGCKKHSPDLVDEPIVVVKKPDTPVVEKPDTTSLEKPDTTITVAQNLATPALTKFSNVVILGNSITHAGPNIPLGWYGDWGMAASARDSDYVHVLKRCFQLRDPDVVVSIKNVQEFETDFTTYNFDTQLRSLRDTHPDLLILRIGENLKANIDLNVFEQRYKDLIAYFRANNPKIVVVGVSTVFTGMADNIMEKYPPYVSLKTITTDQRNMALGLFENYAVATHPGNTGMRNIASLIWAKVKTLK